MNMSLHKFQVIVKDREDLEYYSPWDCKELDMTEWLNNTANDWTTQQQQFAFQFHLSNRYEDC